MDPYSMDADCLNSTETSRKVSFTDRMRLRELRQEKLKYRDGGLKDLEASLAKKFKAPARRKKGGKCPFDKLNVSREEEAALRVKYQRDKHLYCDIPQDQVKLAIIHRHKIANVNTEERRSLHRSRPDSILISGGCRVLEEKEIATPELQKEASRVELQKELGRHNQNLNTSPELQKEAASPEPREEVDSPQLQNEAASPELQNEAASPELQNEIISTELRKEVASPELEIEVISPELEIEVISPELQWEISSPEIEEDVTRSESQRRKLTVSFTPDEASTRLRNFSQASQRKRRQKVSRSGTATHISCGSRLSSRGRSRRKRNRSSSDSSWSMGSSDDSSSDSTWSIGKGRCSPNIAIRRSSRNALLINDSSGSDRSMSSSSRRSSNISRKKSNSCRRRSNSRCRKSISNRRRSNSSRRMSKSSQRSKNSSRWSSNSSCRKSKLSRSLSNSISNCSVKGDNGQSKSTIYSSKRGSSSWQFVSSGQSSSDGMKSVIKLKKSNSSSGSPLRPDSPSSNKLQVNVYEEDIIEDSAESGSEEIIMTSPNLTQSSSSIQLRFVKDNASPAIKDLLQQRFSSATKVKKFRHSPCLDKKGSNTTSSLSCNSTTSHLNDSSITDSPSRPATARPSCSNTSANRLHTVMSSSYNSTGVTTSHVIATFNSHHNTIYSPLRKCIRDRSPPPTIHRSQVRLVNIGSWFSPEVRQRVVASHSQEGGPRVGGASSSGLQNIVEKVAANWSAAEAGSSPAISENCTSTSQGCSTLNNRSYESVQLSSPSQSSLVSLLEDSSGPSVDAICIESRDSTELAVQKNEGMNGEGRKKKMHGAKRRHTIRRDWDMFADIFDPIV